jgi:hypothetical protein
MQRETSTSEPFTDLTKIVNSKENQNQTRKGHYMWKQLMASIELMFVFEQVHHLVPQSLDELAQVYAPSV